MSLSVNLPVPGEQPGEWGDSLNAELQKIVSAVNSVESAASAAQGAAAAASSVASSASSAASSASSTALAAVAAAESAETAALAAQTAAEGAQTAAEDAATTASSAEDIASDAATAAAAAATAAAAAQTAAEGAQTAAEDARAAAESIAGEVAELSDTIVAELLGAGSEMWTAADARYATLDALADFEAQAASIEDLIVSVSLFPRDYTLSGTDSSPVLIAPFPLRVTSVALTFWQGTDIATSDANYWRVEVRKGDPDGVTHTTIATRTTKSTGGVSWLRRVPWVFDTNLFDKPEVDAGQTLNIAFYTTGTPTGIGGPIVATVGYEPL